MKTISLICLFVSLFFLSACNVEPRPINWGMDACHFCKMNIVDQMHAAEYVTPKGKVYLYDAIECMVYDLVDKQFPEREFTLVSDYGNEGRFVDAENSTYIISENIPSPMGEFLSAFSDKQFAQATQQEKEGELFTWEELTHKLSKR